MLTAKIIYEVDTDHQHYQVVDMVYEGRPARVLYSGQRQAAQSGLARDDKSDLLFDYNQRLRELAEGLQPKRLLVIGGGAYTLPMALLRDLPEVLIDVVELDPGLDDIAERFFGLQADPRLHIFHTEGRSFLERNDSLYDVIIIDAFSHTSIPPSLTEHAALQQIKRNLNSKGTVAVNVISSYLGRNAAPVRNLATAYDELFPGIYLFPASHSISLWLPQNFVLVAERQPRSDITTLLRFAPLNAPDPSMDVQSDLGR